LGCIPALHDGQKVGGGFWPFSTFASAGLLQLKQTTSTTISQGVDGSYSFRFNDLPLAIECPLLTAIEAGCYFVRAIAKDFY
jgi:hypothetical protein